MKQYIKNIMILILALPWGLLLTNCSYIDHGNLATWDDVIGSPVWTTGNDAKLPGDYNIVDFNGDGDCICQKFLCCGYTQYICYLVEDG